MSKTRPTEFKTTGEMNLFVCERLSDKPEPPPGKSPGAKPKPGVL